jgi:hypothetical protein
VEGTAPFAKVLLFEMVVGFSEMKAPKRRRCSHETDVISTKCFLG